LKSSRIKKKYSWKHKAFIIAIVKAKISENNWP